MDVTYNPQNESPARTGPRIYDLRTSGEVYFKPGVNDISDSDWYLLKKESLVQDHIAADILMPPVELMSIPQPAPTPIPVPAPAPVPTAREFISTDFKVSELREADGPLSKVTSIEVLRKNIENDDRKGADKAMLARIEELEQGE